MQVVSIITDKNGNIINKNNDLLAFSQLALINLDIAPNQKKLLLNTLAKNYSITKFTIEIDKHLYYQYVFEEWRINNNNLIFNNNSGKIEKKMIAYNSFNIFEQEVMYCLLNSFITDKEITAYLKKLTRNSIKGCIRHTISTLYLKFNTNNRTSLIRLLKLHDFDQYVPVSLFPSGTLL